jgi:hypothetical protein
LKTRLAQESCSGSYKYRHGAEWVLESFRILQETSGDWCPRQKERAHRIGGSKASCRGMELGTDHGATEGRALWLKTAMIGLLGGCRRRMDKYRRQMDALCRGTSILKDFCLDLDLDLCSEESKQINIRKITSELPSFPGRAPVHSTRRPSFANAWRWIRVVP